jgi:hypothetical protein
VATEPGSPELSDVLGRILSRVSAFAVGHVVNQLIGVSVQLEQVVSDFLAVYLGRDLYTIELLGSHIIDQVSYDSRLRLLEVILQRETLTDEFPKLLPTARRVLLMRNQLAHSYPADNDQRPGGDAAMYQREYRRRGVAKRVSLDVQEMLDLMKDAESIISDQMPQLAMRYLPDFNDEPAQD